MGEGEIYSIIRKKDVKEISVSSFVSDDEFFHIQFHLYNETEDFLHDMCMISKQECPLEQRLLIAVAICFNLSAIMDKSEIIRQYQKIDKYMISEGK